MLRGEWSRKKEEEGVSRTSLLLVNGHLGPVASLGLLELLGKRTLLLDRQGLPAQLQVGEGDLGADRGGRGATALGGAEGGASEVAEHRVSVGVKGRRGDRGEEIGQARKITEVLSIRHRSGRRSPISKKNVDVTVFFYNILIKKSRRNTRSTAKD